jgi:hypothetical protein
MVKKNEKLLNQKVILRFKTANLELLRFFKN